MRLQAIHPLAAKPLAFPALFLLCSLLSGCAGWHWFDEPPPLDYGTETFLPKAEAHGFYLNPQDSVVGRLATAPVYDGDTLLDIARHFGLGYQHIVDANPNVDIWTPKQGENALLPLQFILPDAPRRGVVINLAAMRLFYFDNGKLSTWPIGIGREGRATPLGMMQVERKMAHPTWYVPDSIRKAHAAQGDPLPAVVPPGADNPLGDYALYLSRPSYLIHGTDKPFSIGLRASNGCLRLYPEDIKRAFQEIPVKTPVQIVNQPYLLGWLSAGLYLEAHRPFEEIDVKQAKNNLYAKLRVLGKKQPLQLDWPKIEETLNQALGIPVPISTGSARLPELLAHAMPVQRPARLLEQPEMVWTSKGNWQLRTAETDDIDWLQRLAAQLNHLGPRVPAQVVSKNRRHQLLAGPFADETSARKAQRILLEDFRTRSELVKASAKGAKGTARFNTPLWQH